MNNVRVLYVRVLALLGNRAECSTNSFLREIVRDPLPKDLKNNREMCV